MKQRFNLGDNDTYKKLRISWRPLIFILILPMLFYHEASSQFMPSNQMLRDPNWFCQECWERREQKPFYANPENCSTYFHCFKNSTGLEGILRPCPDGSRFDESVQACVPKWDGISCDDPCANATIMMEGWWMNGSDCGIFYQCSNYYSIKMCCPPNHRFNMSWGDCMYDKSCNHHNEECTYTGTVPMWTPLIGENGTCVDVQYGVTRRAVRTNPHIYLVILQPYKDTVKEVSMSCPRGTLFVQETCKCSNHTDVVQEVNETNDCLLNMQCNKMPIIDSSINNYWINNLGDPKVPIRPFSFINPGVCDFTVDQHVEIPGLSGNPLGQSLSIGFWIHLEGDCSLSSGGIMSNRGQKNHVTGVEIPPSILIEHFPEDGVQTILATITTVKETLEVKATDLECNKWYLITVVYHHGQLSIYVNCNQVNVTIGEFDAQIYWMTFCPMAIGNDQKKGNLFGALDEIMICRENLGRDEICEKFSDGAPGFGLPPPDEDIDCIWGEWMNVDECSLTCGGGTRLRNRFIITPASGNGKPCSEPNVETAPCNIEDCPVNCIVGDWSSWGSCSESCGEGFAIRSRSLTPPIGTGLECPMEREQPMSCHIKDCPVDCVMGSWGEWSGCVGSCDYGYRSRSREPTTDAANGGAECRGDTSENEDCMLTPCPVDCVVGQWTGWTGCSVTCDAGTRTRTRELTDPLYGGSTCPDGFQSAACFLGDCPANPEPEDGWTVPMVLEDTITYDYDISTCTLQCYFTPSFLVGNDGIDNDQDGLVDESDEQSISISFSGNTGLDLSPGNGKYELVVADDYFTLTIINCNGADNGKYKISLSNEHGTSTSKITIAYGVIDCEVGPWVKSSCSVTCGTGVKQLSRDITVHPENGGKKCPSLSRTRTCRKKKCGTKCKVSPWEPWGDCLDLTMAPITCGGGIKISTRSVVTEPTGAGRLCPKLEREAACALNPCKTDCVVSKWTNDGGCSVTCGGGTQHQVRSIITPSNNFGKICPTILERWVACKRRSCTPRDGPKVHCKVSKWSQTECLGTCPTGDDGCVVTCGGGIITKTRIIQINPSPSGNRCPDLEQKVDCKLAPCKVNCEMGDFGPWGDCSRTCGPDGLKTRTRQVMTQPQNGGRLCPLEVKSTACNRKPCPEDNGIKLFI